jgi:PKD repeat protein
MKKLLFLLIVLAFCTSALLSQDISDYTFTTTTNGSLADMRTGTTDIFATGTYRDDTASALQTIGFDFKLGATTYSQFSINSNGQMELGATLISGGAASPASGRPRLAALSGDNSLQAAGKVHFKVTGTAPNRVCVIEFNQIRVNYSFTDVTGPFCTFQVWLYETSNTVKYVYGTMYNASASAQWRGVYISTTNVAGNVGNVTTLTATPTWTSTATSVTTTSFPASSDMANLNSDVNGSRRVFTFVPPIGGAAPNPALIVSPANSATAVYATSTLNWASFEEDIPDGYKLYFGTDNPPTNIVNGTDIYDVTTYDPIPDMNYDETYYWQVVPYNNYGDATNCPIWHFGTIDSALQFYQTTIAFDHVWKDHTAVKALRIDNTGNMDLTIDLLLSPGVFALADGITSYTVPVGGHILINIAFTPTAYQSYTRNLYVETNDPNHLFQTISLTGTGYELNAAFTASSYSGVAPLIVSFTDASSPTVQSWQWDFGDGGSSEQSNPSHTYTYAGNYEVTLTVSDAYHSRSVSQFINVSAISIISPAFPNNSINLGSTYLGVPTTSESISFANIGTAPLTISSVYWENGNRGFVCNGDVAGQSYGLNESFGLNVYLLPTVNGTVSDVLIIESNADNTPEYRVTFTGTGLFVPPAVPANITLTMQDENGQISWDAVTLSVLNTPIVPDYYFVYFNGSSDPEGQYYFLGRSFGTQYVHYDVALGASDMFYRVKAIKIYQRGGNLDAYLDQHLRVGMSEEEVSKILSQIE